MNARPAISWPYMRTKTMPDLLVPLYRLDDDRGTGTSENITVRRALAPEAHIVADFAKKHFSRAWASECGTAMAGRPPSLFLAHEGQRILGFACYDATAKGLFGPTGIDVAARGRGIGRRLLLAALHAMRDAGYAYAVIGGAGPVNFYKRHCNAVEIADSDPGYYASMLRDG